MASVHTLYQLAEQFDRLFDMACDQGDDDGRITPDFVNALNSLEGEIGYQMEGLCYVLKNVTSLRDQLKAEAAMLQQRAGRLSEKEQQIKDCLRSILERGGETKRQAGRFTVRIQRNAQPSVLILDMDQIPAKFDRQQPREINRHAVLDAMKAGEDVPGVEVSVGSHVRVV